MRLLRPLAPLHVAALLAVVALAAPSARADGGAATVFRRLAGTPGDRIPVHAPEGELLGRVDDHVVHVATGQVTWLVLAIPLEDSERRVLVPTARFRRDDERGFVLAMTAEELRRLPEFDPLQLDDLARDFAAGSAPVVRHRLASDVVGSGVHAADTAEDEEFATLRSLLLEPGTWTVFFAFLESEEPGETRIVVPWRALDPLEGPEGAFDLAATLAELRDAPRLEAPGSRVRLGREEVLRIHRFYGLEPHPPPRPKRGDRWTGSDCMRDAPPSRRRASCVRASESGQ